MPNLLFGSAWRVVRRHIGVIVQISAVYEQNILIAALTVDDLIHSVLDTVVDHIERQISCVTTEWLALQLEKLFKSKLNLSDVATLVGLDAEHLQITLLVDAELLSLELRAIVGVTILLRPGKLWRHLRLLVL